jgi:hypothetical protein
MYGYADTDQNGFFGNGGRFRVESHTPDSAATHFYDEVGRPHQKMGSTIVALFT